MVKEKENKDTGPIIDPLANNEFFCQSCTFRNVFQENNTASAHCQICGQQDKPIYDRIQNKMIKEKMASPSKLRP